MPKTTRGGAAKSEELPGPVARSDEHAQRTYAKAHDSAVETYGEGERAHRTAYSALKHSYEKVGDHWEPKDEKGPSDDHAAQGRDSSAPTHGGVDAHASKVHLYEVAQRLGVSGRSRMGKDELVEAIDRANRRANADARS